MGGGYSLSWGQASLREVLSKMYARVHAVWGRQRDCLYTLSQPLTGPWLGGRVTCQVRRLLWGRGQVGAIHSQGSQQQGGVCETQWVWAGTRSETTPPVDLTSDGQHLLLLCACKQDPSGPASVDHVTWTGLQEPARILQEALGKQTTWI